jgi:glucose-1-phosphate thymidylyltransferase
VKALVLSGGSGVRCRPFSYSMPKQLMPIANRPVLEYVLGGIRELGVTEIAMVVGDWAPKIAEAIGDGSRFGARITYLRQDRPLGLAHAVLLARSFLGEDDFVMYLGDNILPEGVVEIADEFRATRPAAQIVVHKVPDPRAYGVAEVDPDGNVLRLVEKPPRPHSDLAIVGVYFFTQAIHEAVRAISPSDRGELEITDAIQWLLNRGAPVRATEYSGFWKDTGQAEDVLECNRRLLGDLLPSVAGHVDAASELHGPVVIERGARVVRSRIEGPAIVGAGTLVEDSRIGPNTSIGDDCVLRAGDVADSIVLDGSSITATPGLRGSLIGRHAAIGSSGNGEIFHRLVVGDHTSVEIPA